MNVKPPSIISDEPLKGDLGFGFDAYAETLAEVVANKNNATPLVLGIYGSWGSGKTTLMNGIEAELQGINAKLVERDWPGKDVYRPTKTVWFQAWKYAEEDAFLAALIDEIIKMIRADAPLLGTVKTKLEEWGKTVEVKGAVGQLISWFTAGTVDLKEIFPDPEFRKKLGFYQDFIRFFDGLIWAALTESGIKDAKEFDDQQGALVVFIDDLDRCPQPRVLKVLETIKLFLDKKGCVFIIGAAQDVIEDALQTRYGKKDDMKRFMDKIVQVTFALPQPTEHEIGDYLTKNMKKGGISSEYQQLIAQSLQFNVRSVKRFLNNLALRQSLAAKADVKLGKHAQVMIPWTILELVHSSLAHLIRLSPGYVTDMQQAAKDLERHSEQQGRRNDQWFVDEAAFEQAKVIHPLRPYLTNREIIDLVNQLPSDNKTLRALIGLTATVGTMEQEESTRKEAGLREGPIGLKDMVRIPPGPFLYGENKEEKMIAQSFLMDVYPVTNSQFWQFMKAGGYNKESLWSQEGLKWKQKEQADSPRYWDDEQWNLPDHPVVGVSWYEAQAFAAWAGKRLPTEVEWERVARGTDGRGYPWGNDFDSERCNSAESKIGKTTPVTKYPEGRSPEGCFDMAGNVWEWTSDWYDSDKDSKVIRGCSWFDAVWILRSSERGFWDPSNWISSLGFRCARDAS